MRVPHLATILASIAGAGVIVLGGCVGDDAVARAADPDGGSSTDGGSAANPGDADTGIPGDASKCGAPLSDCAGTCIDLTTTATSCGACGHSCLGGTCTGSKCSAVKVVGGLDAPSAIALSTSPPLVVVTASTALYKCAKSGCANAERMWTATTYPPRGEELSVAISGGSAYSVTEAPGVPGARVSRQSLASVSANPNPLSVDSVGTETVSLAFDGTRLVVGGTGKIRTCLTSGCTYADVASNIYFGAAALTADPNGLYVWGSGSAGFEGLFTCPRSSALPCDATRTEIVARVNAGSVYSLQLFAGTAYWVDRDGAVKHRVLACKLTGCAGTPTVIAEEEEDIGGLAVDAKGAYWTTTLANNIRSCTNLTAGCGKTATSLVTGQTKPAGIALDAEALYWVNAGAVASSGEIMKLAR